MSDELTCKQWAVFRVSAPFDSAPNYGNLCVKGRFGVDYTTHPRRLTTPLIRDGERGNFREATWEEATEFIADRLSRNCAPVWGCRALPLTRAPEPPNEDISMSFKMGTRRPKNQQC
ncbi:MAG UNVERIFIED_CONTAM: molybdopterin-dependent oxidoreductase [Anaerolineae bacterium]